MSEPLLREAEPADVEGYLDLLEGVAAERRWIGAEPPIDRAERGGRFLADLADGDTLWLVAEAGGEIVGALRAADWRGLVSLGMFVAAGWRGRGLGRRLLAGCVAWATGRRAHKLTLHVWPHNTAAIGLYERFGFEVEGRLRRHWRRASGELWDSLIMGRQLGGADGPQAGA